MSLVSKKTRYVLHGLAYIGQSSDGEAVPFEEVLSYLRAYSNRLTLSPSYIAKIFQDVSRLGFTEAVSGPHGGYRLSRPATEINLIDVVEALEGPILTGCCLLSVGDCPRQSSCGVRGIVNDAERVFYDFFKNETIASLAKRMDFPTPDRLRAARSQRKAR